MSQILQPGQHLDPDQLSAFVELALPEHERLATLAHLSECSHCRQIVFLSQQALPQTAPPPHPAPVWTRWFTSTPALSLAAASLACALIVAVSLHLHHISQSTAIATTASPSPAPHPAEPTPGPIAEPKQEGSAAAATSPTVLATPHQQPKAASPAPLFPTHANKTSVNGQSFAKPLTPRINGASYGAINGTGSSSSMPILKSLLGQPQQQATTSQNGGLAPAPSTKSLDQATSSGAALALLPAQSRNTNETVSVEATPAQIQTETTDADSLFARTVNAKKNAQAPLPSNLTIVTIISNGHQTLAADTAGALFLSLDAGQHWTLVDQQWTGKAVQLSLTASPSPQPTPPSQQRGAIHGAVSAAMSPARTGVNTNAAATTTIPSSFQLTTDSGAIWTSPDGLIWKPR
jgi:hypothetical protein